MSSSLPLLLLLPFLSLLLILTMKNKNKNKNKHSSSSIPNSWPLLGMLPSLLSNLSRLHDFVTETLKANGGTFLFKGPSFTNLNFLVTSDPTNLHHIATEHFSSYPKGPELKAILAPFGDAIFNTDGESWKMMKALILSLTKTSRFDHLLMTTLRHKLSTGLLPVLDHGAAAPYMDLQDVMKRFMFDLGCMSFLGFDPGCLSTTFPRVPCAEAFDVIEEAVVHRHCVPEWVWRLQRWLRVGLEGRTVEAEEWINGFLDERIRAKVEEKKGKEKESGGDDGEDGDDYDDLLMKIIVEAERLLGSGCCGNREGERFVRGAIVSLMVAGRDTITVALSWFFWLVATNKGVEEKILQELDRTIVTNPGENQRLLPTTEELNKMVYLHGAISEALRLYPSVPYELKQSLHSDVLPSGHAVGKNARVLVSIYTMGRMEEVWGKDWPEFKPERWVSESSNTTVHVPSYKFAAFMAGPRSCPGRKLAFAQMKLIASCVLLRYRIAVAEGHPVVPMPSLMLFMRYGLKVRVSRRRPEVDEEECGGSSLICG